MALNPNHSPTSSAMENFNFTAPAACVKKKEQTMQAAKAQKDVDDQPFFEMDPL
jgi:hypothetical protein